MKGQNDLLWINFNHDQSLICIGTKLGIRIYRVADLAKCVYLKESRDIGIVQVQSSNLVLFSGASHRFPPNKLSLYDIKNSLNLLLIEFKTKIINLHWVKQWMVAVLQNSVHVYVLDANPRKMFHFETTHNQDGVSDLCIDSISLLAIPGRNIGQVQLIKLSDAKTVPISLILAHSSAITSLKLSLSGRFLATASEKGTLIRIWDVASSRLLNELRRGTDQAKIYSLAFSKDETRIAVSSDKGTIHIFNLVSDSESSSVSGNRTSVFASFSSYLPKYFASEWSWASFSLPVECPCTISFSSSSDNNCLILILCSDGSLYKYRLSEATRSFSLETYQVLWRGSSNPGIWKTKNDFWDDWADDGLI